MYKRLFKRVIDLFIAATVLILISPLFLLLTLLLFIANSGKPFFVQVRPGKNEKLFKLIKLKTMNDKRDKDGNLLPDHQRTTWIGRFIRASSLDEIPQLVNVLLGQMSLIGPRPLLIEYLQHYNQQQRKRHQVRPGITGWAQVNGRNTIGWQQKFEYDVWYVEHVSFSLDAKILYLTIRRVIARKDVNASKTETMTKFAGNS